jgi:CRISPR system Cascade subunit CasB
MTGTEPITRLWHREALDPAVIAACRAGIGREPGTFPGMWSLHREPGDIYIDDHGSDGARAKFAAEHHTLTLWALHQQGQMRDGKLDPVHRRGAEHDLGRVIRRLKIPVKRPDGTTKPPFNPDAVDRRFHRALVAPTVDSLAVHLRGLITQLRTLTPVPRIDYDRLRRGLAGWEHLDFQRDIRRRWGLQYQIHDTETDTDTDPETVDNAGDDQ